MSRHTVALMIETDGPGGAELVLLRLAGCLAERGHTPVPVIQQVPGGWLEPRLRDLGLEPELFREGPPPDLRLVRHLMRRLRHRGVDVVHSHEFTMAVYGTLACRLLGLPHVATIHGADAMLEARRRRVASRWAFRASAAVTTVSRDTRQKLCSSLRLPAERIELIHNGVPTPSGDPEPIRRELDLRPEETLIVAVGSLLVHKGHLPLLHALAQLDSGGFAVPWRLAVAGGRGGEEHAALERFAAEAGLADRVHILTHRDDVPDLLAAADVFAMPSFWEGLPLALLEAMHAGVAPVASAVGGIPEALSDGEHGLLVPPRDVDALAAALRRLLEDVPYRTQLAAAARDRARSAFGLDAMTDAYERVYARVR